MTWHNSIRQIRYGVDLPQELIYYQVNHTSLAYIDCENFGGSKEVAAFFLGIRYRYLFDKDNDLRFERTRSGERDGRVPNQLPETTLGRGES